MRSLIGVLICLMLVETAEAQLWGSREKIKVEYRGPRSGYCAPPARSGVDLHLGVGARAGYAPSAGDFSVRTPEVDPRALCDPGYSRSAPQFAPQVVCPEPPTRQVIEYSAPQSRMVSAEPLPVRDVDRCLTLVELARIGASVEGIRGEQRYGTFALEQIREQGTRAADLALINAVRDREGRENRGSEIDPVSVLLLQKLQERDARNGELDTKLLLQKLQERCNPAPTLPPNQIQVLPVVPVPQPTPMPAPRDYQRDYQPQGSPTGQPPQPMSKQGHSPWPQVQGTNIRRSGV